MKFHLDEKLIKYMKSQNQCKLILYVTFQDT